ncbi:MASE1 domain-containing protein [Streptomyces erythrochromogenes]|uniref:MASE1 domain-containing protein n=1 Tax=Streptomyces erythrochromogenes TaxID=285574 RepID=UPI00368E85BB
MEEGLDAVASRHGGRRSRAGDSALRVVEPDDCLDESHVADLGRVGALPVPWPGIVTPFLLVLRRARWPSRAGPGRWLEAVAPAFGTVFVTLLATRAPEANLLFPVSPFLIWAAFRFRLAGAAPCALVVSTLAIMAAAAERGPFASADVFENMVTLQAFNGTTALTALLLAAVITERDTTHEEIKRVRARLAEMVSRMEPGPESYEHPPENDTPP